MSDKVLWSSSPKFIEIQIPVWALGGAAVLMGGIGVFTGIHGSIFWSNLVL